MLHGLQMWDTQEVSMQTPGVTITALPGSAYQQRGGFRSQRPSLPWRLFAFCP